MTRNFAGFASLREPSFFPRYRIGKDEVSPKGAKEENCRTMPTLHRPQNSNLNPICPSRPGNTCDLIPKVLGVVSELKTAAGF